ncbi:hypothetical protein MKX70_00715 [Paenibacillus sp. FSL R7-0312]|uniref:hypothetical protein n=1 Tax=unclassified Paenibacillus TaxID=185978 RepID=UPI0004F7869C|nr:hypothetical protein [Paenibacillus sp. FSL R5-0912]AIQ39467.1 hypothetical protein R50912_05050 [Paenibacillus sp. FSL R5-0912]
MDWLHDYEDELRLVFQESCTVISAFPEPLNAQGLAYLDQFNVFRAGSHKNYICYLLPFWLQDRCGLSIPLTRQMSVGNVFFMLYFFLQDDLMDSNELSAAQALPLANLLYVEFLNIYRPLFPADSPFWSYFGRYISEWADSVSGEAGGDYFLRDRLRISHKASPLKLTSTAALLLSDQAHLITEAEEMIHGVLLTLQMLDDYEDWEQDLEEGNYNCLLSLARCYGEDDGVPLTKSSVKDFIFTTGGLATYAGTALVNHSTLEAFTLELPHLLSFHQVLVKNLQHMAAAIEAEKQLLQSGGLNYWLTKNMNIL